MLVFAVGFVVTWLLWDWVAHASTSSYGSGSSIANLLTLIVIAGMVGIGLVVALPFQLTAHMPEAWWGQALLGAFAWGVCSLLWRLGERAQTARKPTA